MSTPSPPIPAPSRAGADAQLDKPFSPAVLAERVRALLADRDG